MVVFNINNFISGSEELREKRSHDCIRLDFA